MRAMKDIGIPWLGQIPEQWETKRLGLLYTQRNEKVSDKDFPPLSVTMKGILPQLETAAKTNDGDNRKLVRKGDFAINSRSDRRGSCGISSLDGSVSLINIVLFPHEDMSASFYNWLFHTSLFADEFYRWGHGIVDDLWTTRWSEMKNIHVPYLPLPEQERIAEYLDGKCAEIDELISVEEQMIAELQAYKQSVITETVTRGLNPDAPLKDSGIPWLGQIPEHWHAMRMRFVCEFRNGYTPSKNNLEFWTDGNIPWYRMDDIRQRGRKLKEANQYITKEAVKGGGLFEAGSFILATTATIGEHAQLIVDSLANQRFTNLKIRKSLLNTRLSSCYFFYYLFVVDDYCKTTTNSATFAAVNIKDLSNFIVTLPPIPEQKAIAEYLDGKCEEIDALVEVKQRKIEELKEYKKSVIYEYVTGKREVS